ncbi:5-formyltetrahydrofolate cyclo-ligase [Marinobacter nauticus]|uniref:5-formyltetrahydrofolate cyclo-ligase n=1 Tax=Marinobacter nauticus TaxID=2743 RepID=UPI001C9A27EF|nr:5-formyltetrahydrofolate cyclo-ligase [Marinobacter nauticus]MBY5936755.1 5-formyltetrahydrofolate cyclo-ligase [Marinobacter nauticus]MBY5953983.1 5-formyltetrahydrofolate cyclo-ligase [Marinobacter nauticus]MBY6007776.1 5-formyltetrahydrofolate cyclo-ligase [Marinobacter nauticus]
MNPHHQARTFDSGNDRASRRQLRQSLRQKRRSLSFEEQRQASERLALNLLRHPDLHRARHIGIYLANDGEIDPSLYIDLARKKGIRFYLPILHPIYPGKLVFSPYYDGVQLTANRFGIPEPPFPRSRRKQAWALDAVLFPLVGFDETGGRLGMGGGFYDRTFAFSRIRPCMAPKLVGLAHDFQRVEQLPVEPWDVPLHGVVTDKRYYRFRP